MSVMKSMDYLSSITSSLAYLSRCIETRASLNLNDLNIHSENFYKELLNLIYGYNLINLNSIEQNAASIDLADETLGLCFQVTSTNSIEKIKGTVDKFIKEDLHNKYKQLKILILTNKKSYKTKEYGEIGAFVLDIKKSVVDYKDIARDIQDLSLDRQLNIKDFLEVRLNIVKPENNPKEIKTLLTMIHLLSDDEHPSAGNGFAEKPDPDHKVYKRFSDFSEIIIQRYTKLVPMYGSTLECIRNESDIGIIKQKKMEMFLENQSDLFLQKDGYDPIAALDRLKKHYCVKISEVDVEFDDLAVEFFLLDNLFRCTVFPNKETA
ncbi:MAG: SMEK domain-containing protein [Pantoea sp.]|uniref:SMEK domain-containing protein n=1 Tax=Pantoea sp. TaxID=69393 RepID=UPI0039E36FFA